MRMNAPVKLAPIKLPSKAGPERKHYCPAHDVVMTPVKTFGKGGIMFQCKEGCRLGKHYTNLK